MPSSVPSPHHTLAARVCRALATGAVGVALGCTSPRPTAPLPSVLIVTLTDAGDLDALDAVAAEGLSWDEAWAHAPSVRPALASVLTGQLPHRHGVRDPIRHGPAVPTLADRLRREGWTVVRADAVWPPPLHPGETWGFDEAGDVGEALDVRDPALIWVHGPSGVLGRALAWQGSAPHRHLAVTAVGRVDGSLSSEDAGRVPLVWVGEGFPEGMTDGDPVGQVDLAATVLELTGLPTDDVDGTDLRTGGSERIEQEDARPVLALGRPGVVVERGRGPPVRRIGLQPAPVVDLAPAPWTVRAWRAEGAVPTDPLGSPRVFAPNADVDLELVAEVGRRVRDGRLRVADLDLDRLEARTGPTPATGLLRADLLVRQGRPREALETLEGLWEASPSAGLSLRLAHGHLEGRDPAEAARWFDRVLEGWPDHPDALAGRIRAARLLGEDGVVEDLRARLAVVDEPHAARLELALALAEGIPVDPDAAARACAAFPDDPWSALLRSRALWAAGRTDDALELAETAMARFPRDVALRLELATWSIELGDGDRAVRLMSPVARWFPDDLRVSTLYAAAHDSVLADRLRTQSIRALWRRSWGE